MTKPRILVTGATGKTGSIVATEMLNAGYPVRALVHRNDQRSAWRRARRSGVSALPGRSLLFGVLRPDRTERSVHVLLLIEPVGIGPVGRIDGLG